VLVDAGDQVISFFASGLFAKEKFHGEFVDEESKKCISIQSATVLFLKSGFLFDARQCGLCCSLYFWRNLTGHGAARSRFMAFISALQDLLIFIVSFYYYF
jgi:hypothetical protein